MKWLILSEFGTGAMLALLHFYNRERVRLKMFRSMVRYSREQEHGHNGKGDSHRDGGEQLHSSAGRRRVQDGLEVDGQEKEHLVEEGRVQKSNDKYRRRCPICEEAGRDDGLLHEGQCLDEHEEAEAEETKHEGRMVRQEDHGSWVPP